jgi:hypothetical protein
MRRPCELRARSWAYDPSEDCGKYAETQRASTNPRVQWGVGRGEWGVGSACNCGRHVTGPVRGNSFCIHNRRFFANGDPRMARARGSGDARGARRDGPGGASMGTKTPTRPGEKRRSGQQSGSKRPAVRTGTAKRAPKKGDQPPKGTARPGAARKTRPAKSRGVKKNRSRKP